jgi:hypothetical protein
MWFSCWLLSPSQARSRFLDAPSHGDAPAWTAALASAIHSAASTCLARRRPSRRSAHVAGSWRNAQSHAAAASQDAVRRRICSRRETSPQRSKLRTVGSEVHKRRRRRPGVEQTTIWWRQPFRSAIELLPTGSLANKGDASEGDVQLEEDEEGWGIWMSTETTRLVLPSVRNGARAHRAAAPRA